MEGLKAAREMDLGLNRERRLAQLLITTEDSKRKVRVLEEELERLLEKWRGRIRVI